MSLVSELLVQARRKLGLQGAEEASLPSDVADAALGTLNDMLDGWTIERSLIHVLRTETHTLTPSTGSYTIGAAGTIVATRPERIEGAWVRGADGVDRAIAEITHDRADYEAIADKDAEAALATLLYYERGGTLGTVYLWPVPSAALSLRLLCESAPGGAPLALGDTLAFPGGYKEALVYTLAERLAPDVPMAVPPEVAGAAEEFRQRIRARYAPRLRLVNDNPARQAGGYDIESNHYR